MAKKKISGYGVNHAFKKPFQKVVKGTKKAGTKLKKLI